MKKLTLIALALMLFSVAAYAQDLMEIPAPQGATMITEINMSETDVLGMIKAAIPAFAQSAAGAQGEIGDFIKQLDLGTFSAAIEGVQQVRVMQFAVPKTTSLTKTFDFYQEKLPSSDGWSRIAYDASMAPSMAGAVYVRDGKDFFSVGLDLKKGRLIVARTAGFIDVPKMASWFGNAISVFSKMEAKKQAAQPKPKPKQPAKAAPSVKKPTATTKTPVKK
jgi:hypothetical protein